MSFRESGGELVEDHAAWSEATWDGTLHSYVPSPDWRSRVSPDLRFFDSAGTDLDPVTFEILRNRLWTINMAHGETLTRISGSPVMQALDFNMSILTGDAEIVMNAPFVQFLDAPAPLGIRYVLEHYSGTVGIEEGDVFLCNDPWIAAAHQNDVLLAAPVFVDGELFAWVSNAGHQIDLGGIVPGGWPQSSPDVWSDPPCFPPFKIVEAGVMRDDLERLYLRQSRFPGIVALDLRAGLAGLHYAKSAILEVCEELGAPVVHAAMGQILDNAQKATEELLRKVPDGTWSQVRYIDEAIPGDPNCYRIQVNVTKRDDRMIIDNEGSDPQVEGPVGIVYAVFEGSVLGSMSVTWLADHLFSVGGAARQIDFRPTPGLISCSDHPAPVAGGLPTALVQMNMLYDIFARMLAPIPGVREDMVTSGIEHPLTVLTAIAEDGRAAASQLSSSSGQGSGARLDRDGVNTSGPAWSPLMRLLNLESLERFFPVLYLYRRELVDGAGTGRQRGGAGMLSALIPHRARKMEVITNFGGQSVSSYNGIGVNGGDPAPPSYLEIRHGTDVREMMGEGRIPADLDELTAAEITRLRGKSNGAVVGSSDVIVLSFPGGAGSGDPLLRDPEAAAADLRSGRWSKEKTERVYGVVVDAAGQVDGEATERRREEMRRARTTWSAASGLPRRDDGKAEPTTAATGEPPREVHEHLRAADVDGRRMLCCSTCEQPLSDYQGDYRLGALVEEVTLPEGSETPAEGFLERPIVLRRYCCPNCTTRLTTEVAREGEAMGSEMRLRA
jgi:N-methylhydantoinase B